MKLIAMESELPGATAVQFQQHSRAEALRVWELYQAGIVRQVYFRADRPEAVLVLECADVAEAESALQTLPLVAAGLITFEIIPLAPYPGFARLFAAD
ncbi:MAG: superoxide dismutase [Ardenticatenaceae bacterium]|nr:superoxide dismutase [Ardenticatenaceae bacterium]MCB8988435.1 superoxide dismutase [Ardenticatenaceae bacterium]